MGKVIGLTLGCVTSFLLILITQGLAFGAWGANDEVPDYMIVVAIVIGMPLGFIGFVLGDIYDDKKKWERW